MPKFKQWKTADQHLFYSLFPVTSPGIGKGQYIKTFQSNTLYCPALKVSRNVASRCQEQIPLCNSVSIPVLGKRQEVCHYLLWKSEFCWGGVVKKCMSAKWMEDTCLLLPFTVVVRAASQAYEVLGVRTLATQRENTCVCCHEWMTQPSHRVLKRL